MAPAVDRHWDPLSSLKFWIYVVERFFEKMGFENFGGGALFGFHPLGGAPFPHLTLGDFGPRDPDKNIFCSGGIAPPFGGVLGFGRFALWPIFSRILTRRFWKFLADRYIYSLLSILRF